MKCICSKRMLIYLKSTIHNLVLYCCIICFIFYIMNKIFVMKYAKGDFMLKDNKVNIYIRVDILKNLCNTLTYTCSS